MGEKNSFILFFIFFQKEEVVLVFDNKSEKEMWRWEKKLFSFIFFNLAKNYEFF